MSLTSEIPETSELQQLVRNIADTVVVSSVESTLPTLPSQSTPPTLPIKSDASETKDFDYSKTDLVVYHANCPDGLGAGWVFWRDVLNKDNTKFFPGKYGDAMPTVDNLNVVFVDFAYQLDAMNQLLSKAKSIRVLDHHKTAEPLRNINNLRFSIVLDMDRSGAMIAWDEVHPGVERPWFINDIGDRDLWRWSIPESKNTTRAMFGIGKYATFETFNTLQNTEQERKKYIALGIPLVMDEENTYDALVHSAVDCIAAPYPRGPKYKVRLVECDYTKASEVGSRLVADKLCDFAVMYRYNVVKDEWYLSCRSLKGQNVDLTKILKQFDPKSGGHAEAAGMTIYSGSNLRSYFTPKTTTFVEDDIAEKARITAEKEAERLRLIASEEANRLRKEKEETDRKTLKTLYSLMEYA